MELNVKTLFLVGGIVMTCGAGAALLTWYHHRDAPGLRAWAAALLLSSLGALILRFPSAASSTWIVLAANAVIVAGFAVLWAGVRQFNDDSVDARRFLLLVAAIVIAYLAICGAAQSAGAGRNAASIPFSLFLGLLSSGAAYEVWQGRHRDGLTSRLPTALALAGLGLARLVRAATLALQSAEWLPPGRVAEFHPYTLYATIVFVLATTYGLVLMANESAVRRDAALFADR
jgi:hypothetical protein